MIYTQLVLCNSFVTALNPPFACPRSGLGLPELNEEYSPEDHGHRVDRQVWVVVDRPATRMGRVRRASSKLWAEEESSGWFERAGSSGLNVGRVGLSEVEFTSQGRSN